MSEAELHILKARMHEGRRAKAGRGELIMGLPRGYVLRPSGEVALDPDEEVRSVIQLVFDVFERRGTVRGVLCYLVDHEIKLPDRIRSGPHKGGVRWNRPNHTTLCDMLRHPAYAGAYVYGRRRMDRRRQLPGKPHSGRRFIRTPEEWGVLRRDCWPAYIDWETYTRNQAQMATNRSKHAGVPRGGPALLGGIIHCGLCGRRMGVAYHNNGHEARYLCNRLATTFGGPRCQSISARPVDDLVSELILGALTPSAIEVSLQLSEDLELERMERNRRWAQRLERAHYETALAQRRYEAVDPQNRLVARTLERDWEAALAAEQALQAEHDQELARQPVRLQPTERETIRSLAEDVPALWHATTTTPVDRQAVTRLILDRVTVRLEGNSQYAEVACNWAGGKQTCHRLVRTVRRFEQLQEFDELLEYIRKLRGQGSTASVIAERLNAEGWQPPKRSTFNESTVLHLLSRYQLSVGRPIWTSHVPRETGSEWTLQEVSAHVGVHQCTVYRWLRKGRIRARMTIRGDQRIWLIQMTKAELDQIRVGRPLNVPELQRKPS